MALPKSFRKSAAMYARAVLRELKKGDCKAAKFSMGALDRLNADAPNYFRSFKNVPFLPTKGTLLRIRRLYKNRCQVIR